MSNQVVDYMEKVKMPESYRRLLDDFIGGKITESEFNTEIALRLYQCLDEFKYKKLSDRPLRLEQFLNIKRDHEEKTARGEDFNFDFKKAEREYYSHKECRDYLDKCKSIDAENEASLHSLNLICEYLEDNPLFQAEYENAKCTLEIFQNAKERI